MYISCVSLGTNWGSISNTKIFQQQNIFNSYSQSFLQHSFYFSFSICTLVQLWEKYIRFYLFVVNSSANLCCVLLSFKRKPHNAMLSFILQHCNWHFFASHSRNSCLLNIVFIISGTSIVISPIRSFSFRSPSSLTNTVVPPREPRHYDLASGYWWLQAGL